MALHFRQIRQVGSSKTVMIPSQLIEQLDWEIGDSVAVFVDNYQRVVLRRLTVEEVEEITKNSLERDII